MILSGISLRNFRSHKNATLKFSENLNYIVGGNGEGKTTVLEAAYYLCTTKSFNSKDSEAVNFDEQEFEIYGKFKDLTEDNIRIYFSLSDNRKHYFQNDKLISRNSQIIGKYPVVILSPADHQITQGSPSERRKFIDSIISQASSVYLETLLDYNKIIKQRSAVLARLKESYDKQTLFELDAWTEKLIENGIDLINYRRKFVDEFSGYIKESYLKIVDQTELPEIKYNSNIYGQGDDINNFRKLLAERKEEEIRRTTNLAGPHKDDYVFSINGIDLKTYGSQGQHKTFQSSLRFAEFFYLKSLTGKKPIFLLDDVFGELDAYRAGKISKYLKQVGQAFITVTDFADFSFLSKEEKDLIIKIDNGNISYA
ncbi:MAG: DNA replication and repair protein RecF [Ignavibacteriaceae bacterium]|jgi:DNA replication and repair protein RecF|nr:DNA replication and repair protein RecF [Ignavibacteriaceae bacterium]